MKKFLSLVLALVMTMSLVTISAGAKDFTDADKVTYTEAVDVLSAVKVIDGYTDGAFKPTTQLNRGQAAKILCNMILGPTTASALKADAAPFKDVAADNTFAGYIAYCAKAGIIDGYTDGTFRPSAPLTGYAFMKLLLGALGYDKDVEGYNTPNWSINVAKQAIGIGLDAGLTSEFDGTKIVTREEACLFALNTLKATMVEYDAKTTVNVGGAEVVIAGSKAKDVENKSYNETIDPDGKMQFAEKYFTKLALDPVEEDVFGRPANKWTNNKQEIGTYVDYSLMVQEYTEEVKGNELYDLLGKSVVTDYDMFTYIDGEDESADNNKLVAKNYKDTFGNTGNGVLTQVFVDTDNEYVTIAVINTFLAQANGDYNSKKDSVSLDIYGAQKVSGVYSKAAADTTATIKGEDFAIAEEMKDDEFYLVTLADGEVQTIAAAEIVEGTEITAFKTGKYVEADEKYNYADTARYDVNVLDAYSDNNMKDTTYNIMLDAYGYLIGVEIDKGEDNYVFITGYDAGTSALASKNADAFAIFTDGTTKNIEVKVKDGAAGWTGNKYQENKWYTYTTDKNGVYTLGTVYDASAGFDGTKSAAQYHEDVDDKTIDKSNISVAAATSKFAYGNSDTVYLAASVKKLTAANAIINDVESVTTGVKNISFKTDDSNAVKTALSVTTGAPGGVYALYNAKNGYVIAAVLVGEDSSVTDNLVFTTGSVNREAYDKANDEYTWTIEGILNGEKVTLTYKGDTLPSDVSTASARKWYKVAYKADGTVKSMTDLSSSFSSSGDYIENFATFNVTLTAAQRKDVDLLHHSLGSANELFMDGYTLHIDKELDYNLGIDVVDDCKAVVIENWKSGWKTEVYDAASNNVKTAIRALNTDANGALASADVYAVMKDGLATTVIFVDKTQQDDKEVRPGTGTTDGNAYDISLTYASATGFDVQWKCPNALAAGTKLNVTIYTAEGGLVGSAPEYTVGSTGIAADTAMGLTVAKTGLSNVAGTYDVVVAVGDTVTTTRLALLA